MIKYFIGKTLYSCQKCHHECLSCHGKSNFNCLSCNNNNDFDQQSHSCSFKCKDPIN